MHDVPAKNDDGSSRFSRAAHQHPRAVRQQHRQRARRVVLPDQRRGHVADQALPQPGGAGAAEPSSRRAGRTGRRPTGWRRPRAVKHRLYKERLDFPRHWPYYFIWNRQISNRPGTTILLPIVDLTRQFINVILSLLSEEDGQRPLFVDDWQRFRPRTLLDWGAWFGSLVGLVPKISYQIIGGARRARGNWLNRDYPAPIGLRQHAAHRLRNVLSTAEPDAHRAGDGAGRLDSRRGRRAVPVRAGSGQGQVRHRVPDAEAEEDGGGGRRFPTTHRQPDRHRRRARIVDAALRQVDGRGGRPGASRRSTGRRAPTATTRSSTAPTRRASTATPS